jgi:hypothetical protein
MISIVWFVSLVVQVELVAARIRERRKGPEPRIASGFENPVALGFSIA